MKVQLKKSLKFEAEVEPVSRTFRAGEIIVSSGEVITALDFEALQEFGFNAQQNRLIDYLSAGLVVLVVMAFNLLYIRQNKTHDRPGCL